jgi:hypothetical protein
MDTQEFQFYYEENSKINIILLTPFTAAGSFLFCGLLDGHPDIFVFPWFHRHYNYITRTTTVNEAIDLFIEENEPFFNLKKYAKAFTPDLKDSCSVEEFTSWLNVFCKLWNEAFQKSMTDKDFFILTYMAYLKANNIELDKYSNVVIHLHGSEGAPPNLMNVFIIALPLNA